jgi:hypothetical protein
MKKKPNIIIFNPDQWRSDVLGCHGNNAAVTPFIDDFVSNEAVSFSNAFCQNPFNDKYPETIYRTGDIAKYNENNELVFIGNL